MGCFFSLYISYHTEYLTLLTLSLCFFILCQPANDPWYERASRLGRQVCQHIVGMNPNPGLESVENPAADPEEEKSLLLQPFLLDETICVGEHLSRNEMVLEDFVRVECGEDDRVDNSKNV